MRRRPNRRRKPTKPSALKLPKLPRVRFRARWLLWPVLIVAGFEIVPPALERVLDRPVGRIVIESTFQRVTPVQIEAALAPALGEGFWSLDLAALRERLKTLSWVDSVQLRRAWPDALVVRVSEHRAAARWGETGLLNARGERFADRPPHGFPELPRLSGPDGSEREVASVYLAVRDRLIAAHLSLDTLHLDERGSWRIVLSTGQEVRLGRRDVRERLDRFFAVAAPALAAELHRVEYVDLRYTNGFAVGWLGDEEEPAGLAVMEARRRG